MSGGDSARGGLVASTFLGVGVLLVAALVGMVNYFGFKYHSRFDWTSSRFYSLSEKSLNVVESLDQDLRVVVFMTPGSQLYAPATEILARYETASPRVSLRIVDPERNIAEARQLLDEFQVTSLNSIVLESEGDRRVIEEADLAEYDYSGMQYGQGAQIREFLGEQMITGAILELVEDRKPRILFTSGHGETTVDDVSPRGLSQARELLGRDNFAMEDWASLGEDSVPEGTDLLVIAGPTVAFLAPELEALRHYLLHEGRALLMLDPTLTDEGVAATGFEEWLRSFGVELDSVLVVDPVNPLPFYSAETFFANDYPGHPITEALEDATYPVIFSLARSVRRSEGSADEGIDTREIVRTSADAWGEVDLSDLGAVERGVQDLSGPVAIAVAVEIDLPDPEPEGTVVLIEDDDGDGGALSRGESDDTVGDGESGEVSMDGESAESSKSGRLVVFGDSDFASNAQLSSAGNPTVFLNTINWLVERENLLAIPPRKAEQIQLGLSRSELSSIYLLVLLVLPLASLAAGIGVYLRRRR